MSNDVATIIKEPELIIQIDQSNTLLIEIEKQLSTINSDDGEIELVEVEKQFLNLDVIQNQSSFLEIEKEELVIEFVDKLVINNPDPLPPAEETFAVVRTYEAGDQIWSNRVVYLLPDGRVKHADKDAAIDFNDVLGFSTNNVPTGDTVEIVLFGKLPSASLGAIGSTYWLGSDGQVLTSAPTSGMLLKVGTQISNSEIDVRIGQPLRRT